MTYVNILFREDKNNDGYIGYTASHEILPLSVASSLPTECMDNHYFLDIINNSMYFYTLRPKSWKEDFKSELYRHIKNIQTESERKQNILTGNIFSVINNIENESTISQMY